LAYDILLVYSYIAQNSEIRVFALELSLSVLYMNSIHDSHQQVNCLSH